MDALAGTHTKGLPPRDEILVLLHEHTETPGLRKHALAVEAAMRAYARRFGEDPGIWGATGLIHDFDYEKHPTPEEHPGFGCAILKEHGYPDAMIEAIMGHAAYTGTPRVTPPARPLLASDELCGMSSATAPVSAGEAAPAAARSPCSDVPARGGRQPPRGRPPRAPRDRRRREGPFRRRPPGGRVPPRVPPPPGHPPKKRARVHGHCAAHGGF